MMWNMNKRKGLQSRGRGDGKRERMIAKERKQNSILNNHSATVKHDCQISLKNS